jgi:hypothetical protein
MFLERSWAKPDWRWAKPDKQKTWDDRSIERLERTKILLYQKSLASIAADGIALLTLLLANEAATCISARRRARTRELRRIRAKQNWYKNFKDIKKPGG